MDNSNSIYVILNRIAQDPNVHIYKDDYIFDIIFDREFDINKINGIKKKIKESCSDEFIIKTFYCDEAYAKIILRKK